MMRTPFIESLAYGLVVLLALAALLLAAVSPGVFLEVGGVYQGF